MIEKPKLLTREQSRHSLTPGGSHGDRGMLTYQFMGKQKEKIKVEVYSEVSFQQRWIGE